MTSSSFSRATCHSLTERIQPYATYVVAHGHQLLHRVHCHCAGLRRKSMMHRLQEDSNSIQLIESRHISTQTQCIEYTYTEFLSQR